MSNCPKTAVLQTDAQPLASALRQATDTVHLRLHQHPLLMPLNRAALSRLEYITVLEAFHEFYCEWEPRFKNHCLTFIDEATPLEWLEKDFQVLGLPVPKHSLVDNPIMPSVTASEAIGYLYVKQGATLGGQLISRHVQHCLDLTPGQSQFYFHGFGSRTGPCWNAFKHLLRQFDNSDSLDVEVAKATAICAFKRLSEILDLRWMKGM